MFTNQYKHFQEAGKTTYDDTNSLRMGACVCGVDSSATGTLGGFITVDDCHLGFLTCAHVVGSEIRRLVSVVETGVSSQRSIFKSHFKKKRA